MKSPIKILAVVAIILGFLLLDAEYKWMPYWEEEPTEAPIDTVAPVVVPTDTVDTLVVKKDTLSTNSSKITN